ncbi:dolichyl-phosphate-mannose--protein mannosyltransferase, partial [Pyxidicoccus sp. 3LG]
AFGVYLSFDAFSPRAKDKDKVTPGSRAVALMLLLCGVATLASVASQAQVSVKALVGVALAVVAGFLGWQSTRPGVESRASMRALAALLGVAGVALAVRGFRAPVAEDSL